MEGIPVLDYAPETLLGIGVLLVFFGALVPYRIVKQKDETIAYLRSALSKAQDALTEEQKTGVIVRRLFTGLEDQR